jgi:hypothetical protein
VKALSGEWQKYTAVLAPVFLFKNIGSIKASSEGIKRA